MVILPDFLYSLFSHQAGVITLVLPIAFKRLLKAEVTMRCRRPASVIMAQLIRRLHGRSDDWRLIETSIRLPRFATWPNVNLWLFTTD